MAGSARVAVTSVSGSSVRGARLLLLAALCCSCTSGGGGALAAPQQSVRRLQDSIAAGAVDGPALPFWISLLVTAVVLMLLMASCFFGSEPAAARRDWMKQRAPGALKRAEASAVVGALNDEALTEMSAITRGNRSGMSDVSIDSASITLGGLGGMLAERSELPGRQSVDVRSLSSASSAVATTPQQWSSAAGSAISGTGSSAYQTPYLSPSGGGRRRGAGDDDPELVRYWPDRSL